MSGSHGAESSVRPEIEVVRLGGSLVIPQPGAHGSSGRLRSRLETWHRDRRGVRIWIAGTGAWGDSLRSLQAPLGLDDETCHWAAIELMSAAALTLRPILPKASLVRDPDELRQRLESRHEASAELVFDVGPFLREVEPTLPGAPLPRDWSVTSDSIAARVADWVRAGALTLIKSCPSPAARAPQEWSRHALVDAFFPRAAGEEIELRWVDLSGDAPEERRYPPTTERSPRNS